MCRSCAEQADPTKRRCNRDDGFSMAEADARNRSGHAANAVSMLTHGDTQAASNSLSQAVAAHQHLRGNVPGRSVAPTPTSGPVRDIVAGPRSVAALEARIASANQQRLKVGREPIAVEITRQYSQVDAMFVEEYVTMRLTGAAQADLDALDVGSYDREPAPGALTREVMGVTVAIVRQDGGFVPRSSKDRTPTADKVIDYCAAGAGSEVWKRLGVTDEDRRIGDAVLRYAQQLPDTNEFQAALAHTASKVAVGPREVPTLASAYLGWERQQKGTSPKKQPVAAYADVRPVIGQWIASPGERIANVPVTVVEVLHIRNDENPSKPRVQYMLREYGSDNLIRWVSPWDRGLHLNVTFLLSAKVRSHEVLDRQRCTDVWYGDVTY